MRNKKNSLLLKSKLLLLRLSNYYNKEIGVNKEEKRNRKIIISLTSYPQRLNIVHLAIESLLNQTKKPDKIILWLKKEEINKRKIPITLLRLQERGLQIKLVNENLRSYAKLIYAIKEFSNQIIITIDDDVIYPRNFIEKLYKRHLEYPNCIIAYRCSIIKKESSNKLAPYKTWSPAINVYKPSFKFFFTGMGGVLYPPNSLHRDITNSNLFLTLCPLGDDIWFNAMSLLNKTKVMPVYKNFIEFPIIPNSQSFALWKTNVEEGKNDEQLKKVFDYYDLYKLID